MFSVKLSMMVFVVKFIIAGSQNLIKNGDFTNNGCPGNFCIYYSNSTNTVANWIPTPSI